MQITQVTPEEIRTLGRVLYVVAGLMFAGVGVLIRLAYKLGRDAEKFHEGLKDIAKIAEAVEEVPLLRQRIEQNERFTDKNTSDIRHLMRGSKPDFVNGGEGEE